MQPSDIIRMAREAGFTPQRDEGLFTEMLERFFLLAAAAGANAALEAAARQALEALEYGQHTLKQVSENQWESRGELAMHALRAALAQEQPVKVPHRHEWFSTDGMEPGQMRCIHCGVWGRSPATLFDPRGSLGEPIV